MTVVIDASVVVAGLASHDSTGKWAESVLAGEPLAAPHLMPVEAARCPVRAAASACRPRLKGTHGTAPAGLEAYSGQAWIADPVWTVRAKISGAGLEA